MHLVNPATWESGCTEGGFFFQSLQKSVVLIRRVHGFDSEGPEYGTVPKHDSPSFYLLEFYLTLHYQGQNSTSYKTINHLCYSCLFSALFGVCNYKHLFFFSFFFSHFKLGVKFLTQKPSTTQMCTSEYRSEWISGWKSSTGIDTGAPGMNLGHYQHYGLLFILHLSPLVFYGSKNSFHGGEMALTAHKQGTERMWQMNGAAFSTY